MSGFNKIPIDGTTFDVVSFEKDLLLSGPTVASVVIVSDSVYELASPEAIAEAGRCLLRSATRSGLKPVGNWCLGSTPIDWPLWRDGVSETVAEKAARKLDELAPHGHVRVFCLADSDTVTVIAEAP